MTHTFETPGLLGTHLVVWADTPDHREAVEANRVVTATVERFEAELSIFRPDSPFLKWREGQTDDLPVSGREVLALAERWRQLSGGAFDPRIADLTRQWSAKAPNVDEPTPSQAVLLSSELAYAVVSDGPIPEITRLGDCSSLDVNGVAKGWITDQALAEAFPHDASGLSSLGVAAGGDLVWRGEGTRRVGIENPLRPYDNEPPLCTVELPPGALATSGGARRRLGPGRVSHLIDPRSGRPASAVASVSVWAPDLASADAAATAAAVMDPAAALRWLADLDMVYGGLVVTPDGSLAATQGWADQLGPVSPT